MQTAPFQLATPFDGPAPAQPSSNRPAQAGAGVNGLSGEAGGGSWAGLVAGLGWAGWARTGWAGVAMLARAGLAWVAPTWGGLGRGWYELGGAGWDWAGHGLRL